jgi:hypothetical protein
VIARLRNRLSFANVVSLLALFMAVAGGTAFGLAGRNTVTSDDIVRLNVRTSDIAPNAVTGPKINNTQSGSDAVNADKLDGLSSESYQRGDGASRGEGFVEIPSIPGNNVVDPAAVLGGGTLSFTCGATPSLIYEDVNDPNTSFVTDIWRPEASIDNHTTVNDGGTSANLLPANDDGTVRFQVFAFAVDEVTFSWFFDAGTAECTIASSVQTNGFGDPFVPRKNGAGRPAPPRSGH